MDKDYINNRLAFEMMEKAHIFSLFYSFSELDINGNDEGVYMVIERPEDWAMKKKNSHFLIRRGYNHNIDKTETDNNTGKEEISKYLYDYRQIYRYLNRLEGKALYDTISRYLDIDSYMKWVAFNFFVRNGDYTDEVWFYFDPEINKFSIIPWDYDDLFFAAPHEGALMSREFTHNRLIFSAEDLLDKKIATDPFLYGIYLQQFRELMDQLSLKIIKKTFENTYAELCPYYKCLEIIKMSEYDAYGITDQAKLRSDMNTLFNMLRNLRQLCINKINRVYTDINR
jgi:spore coat protein H